MRERALDAFVDAVMVGDDAGARLAFADAQAFGLQHVRTEAQLWAELERQAAERLPADLDEEPRRRSRRG